jgi:hypothetical protein
MLKWIAATGRRCCAIAGVRKLDQGHLKQHLAVAVDEFAHGGVERVQGRGRRAQGDGPRRRIDRGMLHVKYILGQGSHIGEFALAKPGR